MQYRELEAITDDPTALVSRADLERLASTNGRVVRSRRIASLVQEGLLPQSMRIGSSRGWWPIAAVDQVAWVLEQQERGISNRAIRELVSLYLVLSRSIVLASIDLAELELVARTQIVDREANSHVPTLFAEMLSLLHPADRGCLTWRLKDGSEHTGDAAAQLVLTFLMTEADPIAGVARPVSFAQMKLPGIDEPDIGAPDLLILGSPPDLPVQHQNVCQLRRARPRRRQQSVADQMELRVSAGS